MQLEIDWNQASEFCWALERDPAIALCLQTFDDSPDKDPRKGGNRYGHIESSSLRKWLEWKASVRCGVFVTINQTEPPSRTAASVRRVRALFCEWDQGQYAGPWHLQPSITTVGRSGTHAFWLIDPADPQALDVRSFRGWQRRLIATYPGTDPSINDPSRVMRLPGTWNQKDPARPVRVEIDGWDPDRRYSVAEVLDGLAVEPPREARPPLPVPALATRDIGGLDGYDLRGDFEARGLLLQETREPGKWWVQCPWRGEHTAGKQGATDSFIRHQPGRWPIFSCSHAHCQGRRATDVLALWGLASSASPRQAAAVRALARLRGAA